MKRFAYLLSLTTTAFLFAFLAFTSCEGPAGPAGADGIDGTDGIDGVDGIDGQDGTALCATCHNDASDMYAKSLQAANSGHSTGTAFERNGADCAACHTHEGFIDRMEAGTIEASADVSNPTPPNCRTCHKVHETFTEADFGIRYPDPVKLWINDVTLNVGDANICANCHQPRIPDPMFGTGSDSVEITSTRYGPHHGPQSAMLWGTGAYEVAGTKSYPTPGGHAHAGAGCTECHMAEAYGGQAGGHTFRVSYEYHEEEEPLLAGCEGCHTTIESFDLNGLQTEVEELLDSLLHVLMGEGVMDEDGYTITSRTSPLKVTPEMAGYIYNFKFVEEDLSEGVHNPGYAVALLTNTIEALISK